MSNSRPITTDMMMILFSAANVRRPEADCVVPDGRVLAASGRHRPADSYRLHYQTLRRWTRRRQTGKFHRDLVPFNGICSS